MAVCPAGHTSSADDFCDVCGLLIGPMSQAQPTADAWGSPSRAPGGGAGNAPGPSRPSAMAGTAGPGPGAMPAGGPVCLNCGTQRTGKFCEGCGLNYETGLLPDGTAPSFHQGPSPGQGSILAASQYPPTARISSAQPPAPWPSAPPSAAPPSAAPPPAAPVPSWAPPANGTGPASASQQGLTPAAPPRPVPGPPPPDNPAPSAPGDPYQYSYSAPPRGDLSSPSGGPRSPSWAGAGTASWAAIVSGDRAYYESVRQASGPDVEGIDFPAYVADRQFALTGTEMRIGRHSASRGIYPEIDLTGPPTDPGISRLHAVLIARRGGWSVLDPGSANGTQVNGTEIPVNEEVPLREGDRINIGAWTAITIQRG